MELAESPRPIDRGWVGFRPELLEPTAALASLPLQGTVHQMELEDEAAQIGRSGGFRCRLTWPVPLVADLDRDHGKLPAVRGRYPVGSRASRAAALIGPDCTPFWDDH